MDFKHVDPQLLSEGMALAMSEHDRYLQGRDRKAIQSYTPPVQPIRTEDPTTAILRAGKPVAALSLLAGGVYLVAMSVVSVGAAIMAFVAANAWAIGGGALGIALVSGFFAARSGEVEQQGFNQPPPNDGGKYEWYQEQRQGWRKV